MDSNYHQELIFAEFVAVVLGDADLTQGLRMQGGPAWHATASIASSPSLTYRYVVLRTVGDGVVPVRWEAQFRTVALSGISFNGYVANGKGGDSIAFKDGSLGELGIFNRIGVIN